MIEIFTADTKPLLDENLFKSKLSKLSALRQERTLRYHFPKDRALSLGVGLLCDEYLFRMNFSEKESGFSYNELGKPYFALLPQIRCSLSHSGNMAAAAFSDSGEVGIDIEKLTPITSIELDIANLYFSETDNRLLLDLSGAEQTLFFFRLWTEKESLFKYISGDKTKKITQGVFHFFTLHDYVLTVCSGKKELFTHQKILILPN
jgi:4'-phosphopantetheinyl transferase